MTEVASHDDLNGGGEASGGGGGGSTTGQGGGSTDDNICRDYQRNVCQRGSRCKYRHPDEDGSGNGGGGGGGSEQGSRKTDLVFCHDFQNKECRRINCKFIHCSRADEDYYHSNGELPPRVVDMLHMGGGGDGPGDAPHHDESVPVCKDFLKGDCRRGMRCKFRHVDPNLGPGGGDYGRDAPPHFGMYGGGGGGGGNSYDYDPYYEPPERKRRLYGDFGGSGNGGGMPPGGRLGGMPPGGGPPEYYILEEENAFLRRKVEELKKQVGDLTATNEFLLDQNAQLRLQGKASSGGGHQLGSDQAVSMAAASIAPQASLVSYPIMTPSMRPNSMSQGSMGR